MYLIPPTLFHHPKPKINEKMGDLPKLAWSRDKTGKVDNSHSNLTLKNYVLKTCALCLENLFLNFEQKLMFVHKLKQIKNNVRLSK